MKPSMNVKMRITLQQIIDSSINNNNNYYYYYYYRTDWEIESSTHTSYSIIQYSISFRSCRNTSKNRNKIKVKSHRSSRKHKKTNKKSKEKRKKIVQYIMSSGFGVERTESVVSKDTVQRCVERSLFGMPMIADWFGDVWMAWNQLHDRYSCLTTDHCVTIFERVSRKKTWYK